MPKISLVCLLLVSSIFLLSWRNQEEQPWTGEDNLYDVLWDLGAPKPPHYIQPSPEQIKQGEEIVKNGRTKDAKGKRTTYVSKYYVCTTCHNIERENPDLTISDPETRLDYAIEHKLPFLQGSTFKGIVNRESWYNDDYVKKYGSEKIKTAHKDLRKSIQLCAIECSQGRLMKGWEVEAVLAYYWSLQWKMGDLDLSEQDWQYLNGNDDKPSKIKWLKRQYLQQSPAHFYGPPKNLKKGYENTQKGDPKKGKAIYELSCLWCHNEKGVSHYLLDNTSISLQNLRSNLYKNSHFSLYYIIAYGTYSLPGHRPYMPHYPIERLNKQQVEDLKSYILKK
ncbi:c-type cytochrome [Aureispira anguillae]|uniref:Cytochrome c n=1 Tax=Aureispira anguillae TaxID=2864201 RepID=A0A915YC82_9BACT|nr:c-type cytochrome [Aureispira anguillae]BDS10363.1 cytochrome c [Aureispira anguillae]